jgi:hypothetical protein
MGTKDLIFSRERKGMCASVLQVETIKLWLIDTTYEQITNQTENGDAKSIITTLMEID